MGEISAFAEEFPFGPDPLYVLCSHDKVLPRPCVGLVPKETEVSSELLKQVSVTFLMLLFHMGGKRRICVVNRSRILLYC